MQTDPDQVIIKSTYGDDTIGTLKFCILGDSNVGKTSLLHQFTDKNFNLSIKNTIGVDFRIFSAEYKGDTYKVQIWDTAGQERFRSISSNYVKSCDAYIIVYDKTNKLSFDSIEYWMDLIETKGVKTSLRVLLGNKQDSKKKIVSETDGTLLAEKYNVPFLETSAVSGYNVQKAFNELIVKVVKGRGRKSSVTMESEELISVLTKKEKSSCSC